MSDGTKRRGFGTRAVHAGEAPDPVTGAAGVPIYQNATFAFRSAGQIDRFNDGEVPHYIYSRYGNPTVRCLELKLADLEGAEDVLATASGMAAVTIVALHYVAGGGHLVVSDSLYEATRDFFCGGIGDYGATATVVDMTDFDAVRAAITPNTRALHVEPFSNPKLKVADVEGLAKIAHDAGVDLIVDNTFLSPALYNPIEHGADIVIHSATKYLSGHSNVIGGVIAGKATAIAAMRNRLAQLGGILSPQSGWILLNGVKTLALRMTRHCENGLAVAKAMAEHPAVETVHYPGLPSHPGHELAAGMTGGRFSGMVSVRLVEHEHARNIFLDALAIPLKAVSLGDVASLVWPFDEDGVIRLSVGIEETDDLVADVTQALDAVSAALETEVTAAGS
ncbi:MAG: PLP-dependent aspartate aminotransferase family protein [Chloroflexota bacterium]|nr:PLP-dependent aspartate aminotransferase family protein [Chloroflexota bacterium]